MTRSEIVTNIVNSGNENCLYYKEPDLSIDELFVMWKSIEAHNNNVGSLGAHIPLSFQKMSMKTIFIKFN